MSHEFEKGFSVREPAWHGLAVVIDDYPGREQAMELAGHGFEVVEKPLYVRAQVLDAYRPIKGWKALMRSDNSRMLAAVKDSYTTIQNSTIWDVIDAILKQDNVKYETGGTLAEGRCVWVMAKLDEPVVLWGDDSQTIPYVVCVSYHDGSGAFKVFSTVVRVVCMNTVKAAEADSDRTGLKYSFRHTRNVMDRIEYARAALGLVRSEFTAFKEMAEELIAKPVTLQDINDFIINFIPSPEAALLTDRVKLNISTARQAVKGLLEGPTVPDLHKRTAYGLYLAGTEYLDHVRAYRTADTYFKRCVMEQGAVKQKLAKLALTGVS